MHVSRKYNNLLFSIAVQVQLKCTEKNTEKMGQNTERNTEKLKEIQKSSSYTT